MNDIAPQEFLYLLPEMFLAVAGMVVLIAGAVGRGNGYRVFTAVTAACLVVAGIVVWKVQEGVDGEVVILAGAFVLDGFAFFWKVLLLIAAFVVVFLSERFLTDGGYRPGEYFALILLATTGMMLMVSGFNLLTIWVSLELTALASYILAGFFKHELKSNEAALKYFVLGALSSGILLYGISLLYGASGTLGLAELGEALEAVESAQAGSTLVHLGWLLLAIGLFFKVAAVPFHVWTPDVYEGAPTPVTSFLAVAVKTAAFAILVRIFYQGLPSLVLDWQWVTAAVSILTMVWGNLAALTQTNVKRMLAYSSIAHAGYALIGVLVASEEGLWALLFYLLAYSFMTLGAFGVVILLERREYAGETYGDYAGLARRSPGLAATMLVFMISLTGIPPTGGFFGKVYLFAAAIESGWFWVAIVGVVTSVVSLYYYIGIVVQMYFVDAVEETPAPLYAPGLTGIVGLCAVATVLLGILPGPVVEFTKRSLLPLP